MGYLYLVNKGSWALEYLRNRRPLCGQEPEQEPEGEHPNRSTGVHGRDSRRQSHHG